METWFWRSFICEAIPAKFQLNQLKIASVLELKTCAHYRQRSTLKLLDVRTHFKPTETFQYTHFSSCHPTNTKRGFIKGEALRLLRTNSIKANFEKFKQEFEVRLYNRGYPDTLVQNTLATVQFSDRTVAIRPKQKQRNEILPFVTTYNPANPNLKKILMKHWHLIQGQPNNLLTFSNNLRLYLTAF